VRFGRKNRRAAVQARREINSNNGDGRPVASAARPATAGALGAVASEERNALLFHEAEEEAKPAVPAAAAAGSGDPTQRLLTSLGRFHRYVAKGQAGAPQEFWSDNCMGQLLAAVELSAEQNWKHIIEALTGTARVLQTYENASSAHVCVPFLNDSYEILCLMVGDLIVNNTRSGAMQTWRKRYNKAVEELTAAGLTLVEDEVEIEEEPAAEMDGAPEAEPVEPVDNTIPFAMPEEEPRAEPAMAGVPAEDEPSIDDFLPFVEGQEAEPEDEETAPFAEDVPAEPAAPPESAGLEAPDEKQTELTPEPKPVDEVAPVLDAVCDDLARLAKAPRETWAERLKNIGYRIESLQSFATDNGCAAAADLSGQMLSICRLSASLEKLNEAFFDLAYGFCEAYVDAFEDPEASAVKTWLDDSRSLLDLLGQSIESAPEDSVKLKDADEPEAPAAKDPPMAVEEAEPAQPVRQEESVEKAEQEPAREPEEGTPESLLVTAQRAVASGDMPGAKVLALQAVAHLARAETAKAEARVKEAEAQFQQNAEHIEGARGQVKKAEQEVVAAESRVAEGGSELADARAHCSLIEEKVVGIEKRVSEIEEQIRALQEAREAELRRVEGARSELEQAREQESEVETSLAGMKETEKAARAKLEESRQNVKDLQRHRLELEEMLSQARETLTHHRSSMADIEKTIGQLKPKGERASEPQEELPF